MIFSGKNTAGEIRNTKHSFTSSSRQDNTGGTLNACNPNSRQLMVNYIQFSSTFARNKRTVIQNFTAEQKRSKKYEGKQVRRELRYKNMRAGTKVADKTGIDYNICS